MENSPIQKWENCLAYFQNNVAPDIFDRWFRPIGFYSLEEDTLRLTVPTEMFFKFIEANYLPLIKSGIGRFFGAVKLRYRLSNEPFDCSQEEKTEELDSNLNPDYVFENFVEGKSNKLPLSVAHAIARKFTNTFNPFFLYGNSGVGKTHLLNAIGTRIKRTQPSKRVIYVSAHLFEIQFREASKNNQFIDFMNFYQSIDVLIVDDIQEIAGKPKTENAFFNIFNFLQHNQKQVILSCDRPPVALEGINERLLTRFKWGIIAELEDPDKQLRHDILVSLVKKDKLPISEEVIDYIATNVQGSIRNLIGIVNSLMLRSITLENAEINIELAERVISQVVKTQKKEISVEHVIDAVCHYFRIKPQDIITPSRKQNLVQARQLTVYLTQKHTNMSSCQIGARIRRDHSTVLHSCNQVTNRLQTDKSFKRILEDIGKTLLA